MLQRIDNISNIEFIKDNSEKGVKKSPVSRV